MKFLKRFPENKHEQIRQVMSYIEMCGLSGRDLVSIGGYIDRQRVNQEVRRNKEICAGFDCLPIGKDKNIDQRFRLKTGNGSYRFELVGWNSVRVISYQTKKTVSHQIGEYALGGTSYYSPNWRYGVLLDIVHGKLQLNF
jgi:hypothetical protein